MRSDGEARGSCGLLEHVRCRGAQNSARRCFTGLLKGGAQPYVRRPTPTYDPPPLQCPKFSHASVCTCGDFTHSPSQCCFGLTVFYVQTAMSAPTNFSFGGSCPLPPPPPVPSVPYTVIYLVCGWFVASASHV